MLVGLSTLFWLTNSLPLKANTESPKNSSLNSVRVIDSIKPSKPNVDETTALDFINIEEESKCISYLDFDQNNSCNASVKTHQPKNDLERLIQKTANYIGRFVPMLNNQAKGSDYKKVILNDSKQMIFASVNDLTNTYTNKRIKRIPFLAYTSVDINAGSDSENSFSLNSLMKLKELELDDEGDLKTLLFSQARIAASTNNDGLTTNFGLGLRDRPDSVSMVGVNVFLDHIYPSYTSPHKRLGVGGEYFWQDFQVRNNWYIALTQEREVTIKGAEYEERVVPGWDVELGYRLPQYPQLGIFVRGFNWDYHNTQDNSGLETSINWQANPRLNLEAWVSNEIAPYTTVTNNNLPSTDETFFGLRMKITADPISFTKKDKKRNLINQMTQPVRRRYDILLERSSGKFSNRASGS